MPQDNKFDPSVASSDQEAMLPYLRTVKAVCGGIAKMRDGKEDYLPRFPGEDDKTYNMRLETTEYANIFLDIVESLSAKPFDKLAEVTLTPENPEAIDFLTDVNGAGDDFHKFMANTFYRAVRDSITWTVADFPVAPNDNPTVADERALGVRCYWISVEALSVLSVQSDFVDGQEILTELRFWIDPVVDDKGNVQRRIQQFIREPMGSDDRGRIYYGRPVCNVYIETKAGTWDLDGNTKTLTIDEIPAKPTIVGRRQGGSWRISPPLASAADLQVSLYQDESALKFARVISCYPVLTGNGVGQPIDDKGTAVKIRLSPLTVLYAPPMDGANPSWGFIEPAATSLEFCHKVILNKRQELRELGRQPLTAQTGNITVVTSAFAGQKANSAIGAWSLMASNTAVELLDLTATWHKWAIEFNVAFNQDFDLYPGDDKSPELLLQMRQIGDLSFDTLADELKRRGILAPGFDAETEVDKVANEAPNLDLDGLAQNPFLTPPTE